MAYSPNLAAALSGATVRQLAHWRKQATSGPVLAPEVSSTRPVLYSLRDLVALRSCVYLRRDRSLQMVRKAIANLRSLGELEHLSEYQLVSDADSIFLVQQDEAVDLVKRPHQHVIAEMSDVLRPFVNRRNVKVPDLFRPRKNISVTPGIRGGYPVIVGTRVPYDNVAGILRDGVPASEIKNYYPGVSAAAAEDAQNFASYVDSAGIVG